MAGTTAAGAGLAEAGAEAAGLAPQMPASPKEEPANPRHAILATSKPMTHAVTSRKNAVHTPEHPAAEGEESAAALGDATREKCRAAIPVREGFVVFPAEE